MEQRYDFRMLWSSNALWAKTGYGVQAKHVLPRLQKLGITCAQFAWYGLQGARLTVDTGHGPLQIYPAGYDAYGNDMIAAYAEDFKADLVMTLVDIWVLPEDFREILGVPWMPWFPVDCSPMPEMIRQRAATADFPTTYSQFGTEEARKAGVDVHYVPHGVDCRLFKPEDRAEARRRFGVEDDDTFIIAMVGANKGFPSRKGFPEAARIFKAFYDKHPNSLLYIHCNETEQRGGIRFRRMFDSIEGFPQDAVRFVDQVSYRKGLEDPYMVAIYNAADVLLQPSYAEGFGLPIIEAQACGCPVVVNRCTSMTELVGSGLTVPPLQEFYVPIGGWSAIPNIDGFVEALEWIYESERGPKRVEARNFALQYDWDQVFDRYWVPLLDRVAERLARSKNHEHKWLPTGIFDNAHLMHVPCAIPDCPAEMVVKPDGRRHVKPTGFEMRINGVDLDIEDDPTGSTAKTICKEAVYDYDIASIPLEAGDVVIDIGAQVGVISCYIAKANPGVTVYAYEPIPANFERMKRNIRANGVEGQVKPHMLAVTKDGRDVELWADLADNSGGGSMYIKSGPTRHEAHSTTLATIMERIHTQTGKRRIKLLKIDTEGAEYEILMAKPQILENVDWLIGEIHANDVLQAKGYTPPNLLIGLRLLVEPTRIRLGVTPLG